MSPRPLLRCTVGGETKWRPLLSTDNATLCAQFGLDPHRCRFELSRSVTERGSSSAGQVAGGYVFERGNDTPIGTLTLAWEGERFRDVDPNDERDRLRLG